MMQKLLFHAPPMEMLLEYGYLARFIKKKTFAQTQNRVCLHNIETRMRMPSQQKCNWDAINTR